MSTEPASPKEAAIDSRPIAVSTQGLTKTYGGKPALDSLDLEIREGEIFGYIGPNGAGKTTTIRILAGLLWPSAGSATIHDADVKRDTRRIKELVGYMPDSFGVYENMTLWEYLEFFAAAYSIPRTRRKAVIDDVLALTDLGPKKDDQVSAFSRGMKQRACLAKTLLHNPRVLILDEPASGLDPRARIEFRELLRELKNMGKTILVSSHILTELSTICTTVGILEAGKLLAFGRVHDILKGLRSQRVFHLSTLDPAQLERGEAVARSCRGVQSIERIERSLKITFEATEEDIADALTTLIREGVRVTSFQEELVDLETAFLTITRGELR